MKRGSLFSSRFNAEKSVVKKPKQTIDDDDEKAASAKANVVVVKAAVAAAPHTPPPSNKQQSKKVSPKKEKEESEDESGPVVSDEEASDDDDEEEEEGTEKKQTEKEKKKDEDVQIQEEAVPKKKPRKTKKASSSKKDPVDSEDTEESPVEILEAVRMGFELFNEATIPYRINREMQQRLVDKIPEKINPEDLGISTENYGKLDAYCNMIIKAKKAMKAYVKDVKQVVVIKDDDDDDDDDDNEQAVKAAISNLSEEKKAALQSSNVDANVLKEAMRIMMQMDKGEASTAKKSTDGSKSSQKGKADEEASTAKKKSTAGAKSSQKAKAEEEPMEENEEEEEEEEEGEMPIDTETFNKVVSKGITRFATKYAKVNVETDDEEECKIETYDELIEKFKPVRDKKTILNAINGYLSEDEFQRLASKDGDAEKTMVKKVKAYVPYKFSNYSATKIGKTVSQSMWTAVQERIARSMRRFGRMTYTEFMADKVVKEIAAERKIQIAALFDIYNKTWNKVYDAV